jgi:hypothetical protein
VRKEFFPSCGSAHCNKGISGGSGAGGNKVCRRMAIEFGMYRSGWIGGSRKEGSLAGVN